MNPIDVVVREERGVARRAALVSGGIPLARGRLSSVERLELRDEVARVVPARLAETERWDDGTIRWLGIAFLADVPANGASRYVLAEGDGPAPVDETTLADHGGRIRTHSEPAVAIASPFALSCPPRLRGVDILVVDGAGTVYRANAGAATLVANDAVSALIRVEGSLEPDDGGAALGLELELAFTHGGLVVDVACRIVNRRRAPLELASWRIRVEVDGGVVARCGHFDAIHRTRTPFRIRQDGAGYLAGVFTASTVDSDAEDWEDDSPPSYAREWEWAELHGRLASNWVDVEAEDGSGLTVAVARFADDHPTELEWDGAAVTFHARPLWAEPVRLHEGMAPTVRLRLCLRERFDADVARAAGVIDAPPRLEVLEHWLDADVIDILPYTPDRYPRLETLVRERLFDWCRATQARGFRDRGDWLSAPDGQRSSFTANNEHDALYALCLHYLRSGEPAYLASALSYGDHLVDIDLIHFSSANDFERGALRAHGREHVHYVDARTPAGAVRTSVDTGHQWVEGLLLLAALTADVRYREAAERVGEALLVLNELGWARPEPGPRNAGWPLIALTALARSMGRAAFLDGARSVAEHALAAQSEAGGWTIRLGFTRSFCAWQNAILVTGLARLLNVDPSPPAALRPGFERAAHALLDRGRLPDGSFSFVDHPDYRWPWSTGLIREALAAAFDALEDERFLRAGLGGASWHRPATGPATNNEIADWRGHLPFLARADRAGLLTDLHDRLESHAW